MQIRIIRKESKHSKIIRSIQNQILTFRKGFEAFICNFEPFKRDSKHLYAISNNSKGIRSIEKQIPTIAKRFEEFKCKF